MINFEIIRSNIEELKKDRKEKWEKNRVLWKEVMYINMSLVALLTDQRKNLIMYLMLMLKRYLIKDFNSPSWIADEKFTSPPYYYLYFELLSSFTTIFVFPWFSLYTLIQTQWTDTMVKKVMTWSLFPELDL